jgi:hypothetical protein
VGSVFTLALPAAPAMARGGDWHISGLEESPALIDRLGRVNRSSRTRVNHPHGVDVQRIMSTHASTHAQHGARDAQRLPGLLVHARVLIWCGLGAAVAAVAPMATARAQAAATPGEFSYRAAIRAGQHAEAAHDDAAARDDYLRALTLIKGHPDVVFLLARSEAKLGHAAAAVSRLRTIAAMGLAYPIDQDSAFASLRGHADFESVRAAMDANRSAVGTGTVAHVLADTNMLAEDLAYDPHGHTFYVSSVHRGAIIAVPETGPARDFVPAGQDGVFGILAVAVDASRGVLWATTSAMPQADRYRAADSGRSAVLRYELASGRLLRRLDAPRDGRAHNLGDMTIDPSGTVIVSDGTSGDVYTVHAGRDTLETLVARGTFRSPQTPAVLPDGRVLIADYALGLAIVNRQDGTVTWVAHPDTTAVSGIDGMYLQGHTLFAVQNGTSPERVVRFTLDSRFESVTGWTVIERGTARLGDPTHGVIVGNTFYFLANSGWDRFGDDGAIKAGPASPPTILRIAVN